MYFVTSRGAVAVAASTPPIIAPMTPTLETSEPPKNSPLIGVRGRRFGFSKRSGVGSSP